MPRLALCALLLLFASLVIWAVLPNGAAREKPYTADVKPASDDGERAMARFRLPPGIQASLWAAEPHLANPVAFSFDERGRCYVAETFRLGQGVTDNRSHMDWLDEDLASRTVADRVAMYRRHLKGEFPKWEVHHDRVRLLEDTKGIGKADKATVFADGFHHASDGLGAGVLARKGDVYYTCIPDLWLLRDTRGTGKADVKQSLASGFGVHVAFIGHDLHGLTMGPDGRIYFSVGDRGLNITTKEGKHLFNPDSGAVLRCEPDGSNLEIVHIGLRNPQELAFDDFGNLFTCDNNSDAGDKARWVQIVEGGDSGWRTGYQYGSALGERGPWSAEKLWHLQHEGQPAYILPPLAHIADGPSGLCYNPGVTGLPEQYAGHFFLCDFRGAGNLSGVWTFQVKPKGASFELVGREQFAWSVLATDCDFGPDGGFYVSDWVNGWNLTGQGRIYKFADPERLKSPSVQEVKKLLAEKFSEGPRPIDEELTQDQLLNLLGHPDQRIRQAAQFDLVLLAARGMDVIEPLGEVAKKSKNRLARLHAIRALGQLGRLHHSVEEPLEDLLRDADVEVRVQALRSLRPTHGYHPVLVQLIRGERDPRVLAEALLALGRCPKPLEGEESAYLAMAAYNVLRENGDRDPYLRHAGVMALTACKPAVILNVLLLQKDRPACLRRAAAVALRRQHDRGIVELLDDPDPSVVAEAVRAAHDDEPINAYWVEPKLAALLSRSDLPEPIVLRVLNTHFRFGQPKNAEAVASYAARTEAPEWLRVEAVKMLGDWAKPPRRDRVTGLTQNLPERPAEIAVAALRQHIAPIMAGSDKLREATLPIAARMGIQEILPNLLKLFKDRQRPTAVRVAALHATMSFKEGRLKETLDYALNDPDSRVRSAARQITAGLYPETAVPLLRSALATGTTDEQQEALAVLGGLREPAVATVIAEWLDKLLAGQVPPPVRLDLLEAAAKVNDLAIKERLVKYEASRPKNDHLAAWREALEGGNARAGRDIFLHRESVSCLRCHKIRGIGGEVGPALDGIGGKQSREYLLESLVEPSKQIAKGFETLVITLTDGRVVTGVLKSEDAKEVRLVTAEGKPIVVKKDEIDDRRGGPSAMPADLTKHLSKRELRDLVEFLATLK